MEQKKILENIRFSFTICKVYVTIMLIVGKNKKGV